MSNDFESWKQDATPYTQHADVCLDRGLVAIFEAAARKLDQATRVRVGGEDTAMLEVSPELENHVAELEKQVQAKTRRFTFEAIGKRNWRKLMAEHPPTEDALDKRAGYNVETFVPAALAATCTDPGLTLEQADWLVNEQDEGVVAEIIRACFDANVEGGDEKKAAATAEVARSRTRLTER